MTQERFEEVVSMVKEQYTVLEDEKYPLPEEDGGGQAHAITFESPFGKLKMVLNVKPKVEDKKTLSSRRAGSETVVQYTYSDTENVTVFELFSYDEQTDEWKEMDAQQFLQAAG